MGISPINSSSNNNNFPPLCEDNVIKQLEKQKVQLQEQIQKVNESKMDDKMKQERIKALKEQIQQIDTEIHQRQMEKINQNKNQDNKQQNTGDKVDSIEDNSGLTDISQLTQASATYTQAKIISTVRGNLKGKSNVLNMEIKLDSGRGGDPKRKVAELENIESKERIINKKWGKLIDTTSKHLKEAASTQENDNDIKNEVKNSDLGSVDRSTANGDLYLQDQVSADTHNEQNTQQHEPKTKSKHYNQVDIRI